MGKQKRNSALQKVVIWLCPKCFGPVPNLPTYFEPIKGKGIKYIGKNTNYLAGRDFKQLVKYIKCKSAIIT